MSIIKNDDQICLSYTGETFYDDCGGLLQETGEYLRKNKLILTDGQIDPAEAQGAPRIIYLEDCETTNISFPCNEPTKTIDQGKFVEIVNTCTEPITVTGLTNSDPSRFTIFDLEYRGIEVYHSGVCENIPFTIAPYTKYEIPSFFHPARIEIEDGNAGSYENRTGDSWSAKISMYPGFPILGCEGMDPCDSFYTLSGELLCNELNREPLKNIGNFQGVYGCTGDPLADIEISECLITSGIYTETIESSHDNFMMTQSLAEAVRKEFYNPYDPPDVSMYMAASLFKKAIFNSDNFNELLSNRAVEYIKTERDSDGGLVSSPEERWDVTGVYKGEFLTVNYGGELYTGMRVSVSCYEDGPYVNDVGVFFNVNPHPNNALITQYGIFLSEWGDFSNTTFCYSRDDIELEVEPYQPITDIDIWSQGSANTLGPGHEVSSVTEETVGRVGFLRGTR